MSEKLPLHVVEKKITHIDEKGDLIQPDKPNGYKFETLVLDMIHELPDCLPYEVVREREFAPIKNSSGIDSVESAQALCIKKRDPAVKRGSHLFSIDILCQTSCDLHDHISCECLIAVPSKLLCIARLHA
jgi:UDP-N-acetylglucosamine pyrophosphorylase